MTIQEKSNFYTLLSIILSAFLILYIFTNLNRATGIIKDSLPERIRMLNNNILIRYLAEQMVYYDEVLTQSARNYSYTSDKSWQTRYFNNEKELDKVIAEAIEKSTPDDVKNFNRLKEANNELVDLEYQSFKLVEQEKTSAALDLMDSQKYWQLKGTYLASIKDYSQEKGEEIDRLLQSVESMVREKQVIEDKAFRRLKIGIITYAILLLSLIVVSNTIFIRTMVKRIVSLKKGAEKIAKGQFDLSIHLPTRDEFESLASTLNSMGSNLKTVTNKLNQEVVNSKLAHQRKIFSRDLHDRLGIIISSLKLQIEKLSPQKLGNPSEESIFIYKDCVNLLNEAYAQIREIANNPVPDTIIQNGLKESLSKLFSRAEMIFSKKIKFITNVNENDFEERNKASIYSLIRELLNNSIKHADCNSITVQVIKHEECILFMFEDDGQGFDPKNLKDKNGIGLNNAKERVKQMNGSFYIDSQPKKGTTISFEIPR